MKTETCKLYSRDFGTFLPKIIKIDLYDSELYCFKVGAFFETQCSYARKSLGCWGPKYKKMVAIEIWPATHGPIYGLVLVVILPDRTVCECKYYNVLMLQKFGFWSHASRCSSSVGRKSKYVQK